MRDIAQFLKVLADETRLQMLWLLSSHGELCVCDIMETLSITQSKASRHLATLRHAGVVSDRRDAAWSYYSLRPAASPLERELMQALQERLAEHPDAPRLLDALDAWMARKVRGALCASKGPKPRSAQRGSTINKGAEASTKARSHGGSKHGK